MVSGDPRNPYVRQLRIPSLSSEEAGKQFDTYVTPGKMWIDSQWVPAIVTAENQDRYTRAQATALEKLQAPQKEADLLNEQFNLRGTPQSQMQSTQQTPGIFSRFWNGLGKVSIPLEPSLASEKIEAGTVANEFMSGFNEKETVQTEIAPTRDSIKEYLNAQAPIVTKMIPRAKGENFPLYGPSIGTYANTAESLLTVDQNGNPSFNTSGLNPDAASAALYSVAITHRQNYMNALLEAQTDFKMATDKEEALKKYNEAVAKAKQQFPLYNQTIGQSFGQRYAK
jgi:hypothetical protein